MSRLKVYSSVLEELHTIDSVISCSRTESINSDNTLSFSMYLDSENKGWINDTNVIGLDGDYFEIAKYKKGHNKDGKLIVSAECEHVSCRLNDPEYDIEYYTAEASPASILSGILSGTGFTAGTVEFTGTVAYSLQEKMSRRAILVQLTEYLGGELLFNGFTVSILAQRGSSIPKDLREGRNITVISKDVDKTSRDELGNPTVAYECDLIEPMELSLGDAVTMAYDTLDIDITLRIVSITTNPYNSEELSFSVSNTVPAIEDEAYEIAATTVSKDKVYNGTRIGPEYGFEAVRSDKKARAYFRSDGMKFQSGDGSGSNWTDKLYYAYDSETGSTELYFNGKFTADVVEALSAVISPNLYAKYGRITDLISKAIHTDDERIPNYLASIKSEIAYFNGSKQTIDFIIATTDGNAAEQLTDLKGRPLYWDKDIGTATLNDDGWPVIGGTELITQTDETPWPVTVYKYTEQTKGKITFYDDSGTKVMCIKLGAGTGSGDIDKLLIYKKEDEAVVKYLTDETEELLLSFSKAKGLRSKGRTAGLGLRNIAVGPTAPEDPNVNDIWIRTV